MSRLAISNLAWPREAEAEALALAASVGFTGVELAPTLAFGPWETIRLADVRTRAAALSACGLPVVALQAVLFGVAGAKLFGSPEERARLATHLGHVARISGACGGVPCVFGAPAVRDPGLLAPEEAMAAAAAFFAELAPLFAAEGAALAFEANPAHYGCRFATHTVEALALVRRVGRAGFGLQIDTGTMLMNAEEPALLAAMLPAAVHCHVSAPNLARLGPYRQPLRDLLSALRAAGWKGGVSVEMRATTDWQTALAEAAETLAP
jgi:sugar phosphate isomerase/epimerase